MILHIPQVLNKTQASEFRTALERAPWGDGRDTAGYLSSRVKNNAQLPEEHPLAQQLGHRLLDALDQNQLFISAALPLKVVPPLFNRYSGGQSYGDHIDGAVRPVAGTPHRVRTDLSATLFLSEPTDYDGGELLIAEGAEPQGIKLAAGDIVLYDGGTIHRIAPVARGARLAAFFWVQSMVRDGKQRHILFELDTAIQKLTSTDADRDASLKLASVYHNLLRQWSDT